MSKVVPEKWIQTKVTVGFIIIVVISLVIFTISYFSVISIIKVQNKEYGHEREFTYLNQLIFEIIETEGVSRVYGITGESSYKNEYTLHHDSVLAIIDYLPRLFPDSVSINGINEIKKLYNNKKEVMDQLVQINIINLHSSSTQNLLSSIPDSLSYEVTHYTYTSIFVDSINQDHFADTLEQNVEKERRGFLKRMSDFLGGKKRKEPELEPDPVVTQQVDSTVMRQVRADQNIKQIKTELEKVSKEVVQFNLKLKRHENDLIKLDRQLTEQLKTIVKNLQDITIKRNVKKRKELEALRSGMIDRILMLMGSAIFLMLFFIYWISRDISKSKKLKNDIIRSKEKVDRLLKVKEQFVAHMSHEIRTPLTSIIGFSEQLNELNQNKELSSISERIRLSAEHLNGLINNILDFSLLETGNVEFYKDQIDAEGFMHELYQLFELKAQKANIAFSYHTDSLVDCFQSDSLRLKQVMINLIGNAIKFTSEGSVIFDFKLKKDKLIFSVVDTGIGIPKDKQKTIFKMFNQVNISLSRKYSGTGLGLSISRQIIEAMGGAIYLDSKVGEGSTFKFEIPYVKGEKVNSEYTEKLVYNFANKSIMAIDDDEMICQLIDGILHDKVKRLDVNTSSSMALHAIDHIKYDLFIVDLHMPRIDGLQMLEIIRGKKHITTPILFLTADMVNSDLKKAHREENIWVMSKPFTQSQILAKLAIIFKLQVEETVELETSDSFEDKNVLFSLDGVKSFTGNDEAFLHSVIQTFILSADECIKDMKNALNTDNPQLIVSERAHKLLTGFRQFKIVKGIDILSFLEKYKNENIAVTQIEDYIAKLNELWANVKVEMIKFMN